MARRNDQRGTGEAVGNLSAEVEQEGPRDTLACDSAKEACCFSCMRFASPRGGPPELRESVIAEALHEPRVARAIARCLDAASTGCLRAATWAGRARESGEARRLQRRPGASRRLAAEPRASAPAESRACVSGANVDRLPAPVVSGPEGPVRIARGGAGARRVDAREVALRSGASAVLRAMDAHPTVANVQAASCRALADLAAEGSRQREELLRLGGVEAVLRAMRRHPTQAAVQETGYRTLRSLAAGSAEAQARILECGVDIPFGPDSQGDTGMLGIGCDRLVNAARVS